MSSVGRNSNSFIDMHKNELEALLRVCVKDLLDTRVTLRAVGGQKIRRQIARILTRLNCL